MVRFPFIGRDAELSQIRAALSGARPATILLSGPAGMGKSRLMHVAREMATQEGWRVAPEGDGENLVASPEMTSEDFEDRVRGALGIRDARSQSRTQEGVITQRLDLPRQLGMRPTFLVLDGYAPGEEFRFWFERRFLSELERWGRPVVVLVADLPSVIEPLAARLPGALHLSLGPLPVDAVRAHLAEVHREANPPLETKELDAYAAAAAADPQVLNALLRVLPLSSAAIEAQGEAMATYG